MVNIVSRYVIGLEGANRFDTFFGSPYAKGFKKFWGFDARQGYDPELFDVARFEEHYGRPPKNAEVGCTWSHLNVYKKFLEEASNDDDILIVAEDDAIIDADVDALVQKIFTMYPKLGIVNLADGAAWASHTRNPFIPNTQISVLSRRVDENHKVGPYGGRLICTGLYGIKYSAAKSIIKMLKDSGNSPYWVADEFALFEKNGNYFIYAVRPGVCGWTGDSTITESGESVASLIYRLNSGDDRRMIDKLRSFLAPRARFSNFKMSFEATKKHVYQIILR